MEKAEEIKNGRLLVNNGYGITYNFEIVEKISPDYSVWCFPKILDGEYAPFCKTVDPGNKECFDVDTSTIKAVRLNSIESEILRQAAYAGAGNLEKAKKLIGRTAKTAHMKQKQETAKEALPILERITKAPDIKEKEQTPLRHPARRR